MYALVTRATVHDRERGNAFLKEQGAPQLMQAPGFVSAQWVMVDENTGAGMLTFESEEAARAAAEHIRANPPGGGFVTIDSVEIAEVIHGI